jgi:DNA-binding response OmpR family regulator
MTRKSTVLIVDDEPVGRDTLEALLFSQGYDLAFASNGNEALEQAARLTPDVILLDVMMPGMNGYEVCRQLRADPVLAKVPVIMVTTLDDRESRLKGIEAGADDFLPKPYDRHELRMRVQTIVRLNRYRHLLHERAKFEWVVDQADQAYVVLDESNLIVYANPQARRYLNLPTEEGGPFHQSFLDLIARWYRCEPQDTWAAWPRITSREEPLYLVRSDWAATDAFWLRVDVMEMTAWSGESYLVRLSDVTEIVASHRATWTFHTQVCHKLRTPLALLTGFLDVLNEEPPNLTAHNRKSITGMARRNAHQLQDEIQEILQYVEAPELIQSGNGRCILTELPTIFKEIGGSLDLLQINVAMHHEVNETDSWYVPVSQQAVEMMSWELLENAKKFHPQRAPTIDINLMILDQTLRIQVRDDGQPVPPDQLSRIWTPYYQIETYHSGQVPGMGLGLSIVASLVWELGGTCRAYNREDQPGLIVEITLPLKKTIPS